MILEMFSLIQAWLILYLITKSLASVLITKAAQCKVLINRLLAICMCKMDVAISFLMLALVTTIAVEGEENDLRTILSSCWRQILLFFSLLDILKENQSEKLSMILKPREIPSKEDVLKDLSIHIAALLCILPRIFSRYDRGVCLQNYSWKLYRAMGKI